MYSSLVDFIDWKSPFHVKEGAFFELRVYVDLVTEKSFW